MIIESSRRGGSLGRRTAIGPQTTLGTSASSRRGTETRRRTVLVAVRLLPAEWEALQAAALDRKISMSELLRSSALREVDVVGG